MWNLWNGFGIVIKVKFEELKMIACRFCVGEKGLTLNSKHLFKTQEELNDHLESVHHMPIINEGETEDDAMKRFLEKYPEAKDCPECKAAGAKWVTA